MKLGDIAKVEKKLRITRLGILPTILVLLSVACVLALVGCVFHFMNVRKMRGQAQIAAEQIQSLTSENVRLLRMVECDDLTSARSRRYMRELFARTRQDGRNVLAFFDLDNFKSVNDGFGHRAGDALLRCIADNLKSASREGEIVFRVGGDEFGVYMQSVALDDAVSRAENFVTTISKSSITVDGIEIRRTASAGVTRVAAGQDLVGALYYADEALYSAKKSGGNMLRVTEGETLRSMIARRTGPRPEDIAEAVRREEVTYFVQPVFDTRTGRAVGVEALLRWMRSDGRVLLPNKFLNAMEDSQTANLVPPVRTAAKVANLFSEFDDDFYCAFNISSHLLECPRQDSDQLIDNLLGSLDPRQTVFELVENVAIRNLDHTRRLLDRLRERGVRVALDDFGTGMSNLHWLNKLNVDIVKIDKSFVRGVDAKGHDKSILQALHELSHKMGFDVVAEGVETEAELAALQEIGIHYAQGYLLGRPAKAEYWQSRLSPDACPVQSGSRARA